MHHSIPKFEFGQKNWIKNVHKGLFEELNNFLTLTTFYLQLIQLDYQGITN